jgi:hypothetical protein
MIFFMFRRLLRLNGRAKPLLLPAATNEFSWERAIVFLDFLETNAANLTCSFSSVTHG